METFYSLTAICIGAMLGAIIRWLLGIWLNPITIMLPIGTLIVNLVGGYFIGFAISFFTNVSDVSPIWRLFIITGFLGSLTTFSTFTAEVYAHLQSGKLFWACSLAGIHFSGSLLSFYFGMKSFELLKKLF